MDGFSSSPTVESFPPGRFGSPSASPAISPMPSPTQTEVDYPIHEMDESFNSSMSFSMNESPPRPSPSLFKAVDMLASPTPMARLPRRNGLATKSQSSVITREPLSFGPRRPLTSNRSFGRDLTNMDASRPVGNMPPPAFPSPKTIALSPAPLKTTLSQENMGTPRQCLMPRMGRRESAPTLESPGTFGSDKMDVDSPRGLPSVGESPGLGSYFCESPAAPVVLPAKRRVRVSSSPGSPSSPSTRRRGHDRSASSSALTIGCGSRAATQASRRSAPYNRRPSLYPLAPVDGKGSRATAASAYPIMYDPSRPRKTAPPGMRRALSVCDQEQDSDDDSDMDASPSTNMEYQRRYGRVPPDANGSPGLKLKTNVPRTNGIKTAVEKCAAPVRDFETDELDGKILPCEKSRDDRLARITPQTMTDVLAGKFNDRIRRYHVFDCRFGYEYEGGHIAGAVNVRSEEQLEELLFTACSGVNETALPTPSQSGQPPPEGPVVIILHCEFSAKRAPKFAGHLRTRDRNINGPDLFPKIHYPELYILQGGYCGFFKHAPTFCKPQAYVPMDDPRHIERRDSDLHDFRKFSRTRSFTYGEYAQASFGPVPVCGPLSFAAGSMAQSRRGGGLTITEEAEPDSSPASNGSPCPRAVSMGQTFIFGSTKQRTFERSGLQRYASCADAMVRR